MLCSLLILVQVCMILEASTSRYELLLGSGVSVRCHKAIACYTLGRNNCQDKWC